MHSKARRLLGYRRLLGHSLWRCYFDFFTGAFVFVDFFAGAFFSTAFAAFLAVAILELLNHGPPMGLTKSSGKPCEEELAWALIQPTYAHLRQANLIVLNYLSIRQKEEVEDWTRS